MKIVFLNIYQNLVDRGAETFVRELSKRLSAGHDVTVIGGDKIPAKRWPILWRAFVDPQGVQVCWWTLTKLFKIWRERYDIVVPLNGGWQPAFVRLVTWLYGGKMVISGQAGLGWDDRNNLWCFPDSFVALSAKAKKWAESVNPLVKNIYIPNGVDTRKFRPDGRKLILNLSKPIFLCVGALTKSKRIDLAFNAVSKLEQGSLLVVGDGDLRREIQFLGNKLLKNRFKLIKLPYAEMPTVYRAADVFTLPSQSYQSFEVVLTEAMATGLPVVANNDAIRKEIVGDAGFLVDPTNIDEYAKALKKTLKTDWGDKPRLQAKKFDWDRIVMKYEELFNTLTE